MAVNPVLFSSAEVEWGTPDDLFQALDREFRFTLDAAATEANAKADAYLEATPEIRDAYARLREAQAHGSIKERREARRALLDLQAENLAQAPWDGVVWCNPPYGFEIGLWTAKARAAALAGATVVLLVPARVDTGWWNRDLADGPAVEWRFVTGRLRFSTLAGEEASSGAAFPSALIVLRPPLPPGARWPRRVWTMEPDGSEARVVFGDPLVALP